MFNLPTVLQPIIISYLCPDCEADAPIVDLLVSSVGRETLDEFGHAYHGRMWRQHGANYLFMPSSIIESGAIDEMRLMARASRGETFFEVIQRTVEEKFPTKIAEIPETIIQDINFLLDYDLFRRGASEETCGEVIIFFTRAADVLRTADKVQLARLRTMILPHLAALKSILCLIATLRHFHTICREIRQQAMGWVTIDERMPTAQSVAGRAFIYRWYDAPEKREGGVTITFGGISPERIKNAYALHPHSEVRKLARNLIKIYERDVASDTYRTRARILYLAILEIYQTFFRSAKHREYFSTMGLTGLLEFIQMINDTVKPTDVKVTKKSKGEVLIGAVEMPSPSPELIERWGKALDNISGIEETVHNLYSFYFTLLEKVDGIAHDVMHKGRVHLNPALIRRMGSLYLTPLPSGLEEEEISPADVHLTESKLPQLDERKTDVKREKPVPSKVAALPNPAKAHPLPPDNNLYYDDRVIDEFAKLHQLESWIKAPNAIRIHTFSPRIDKYAFAGAPWARVTAWGPKRHLHLMIPGELLLPGLQPLPVVFDYTFYPDPKGGRLGVCYHRNMRIPGKNWWSSVVGPAAERTKGNQFISKKGDDGKEEFDPATGTVLITLKDHAFRIYQGGHRDV